MLLILKVKIICLIHINIIEIKIDYISLKTIVFDSFFLYDYIFLHFALLQFWIMVRVEEIRSSQPSR